MKQTYYEMGSPALPSLLPIVPDAKRGPEAKVYRGMGISHYRTSVAG